MDTDDIGNTLERSTHVDCTLEGCDLCRELARLEEEVHIAHETFLNLTKKRTRLNFSRNARHDRLTNKLPPEIISHIFMFVNYANNYTADMRPAAALSNTYFCAPVILSSVCRRWREIALSLSSLWTDLYINVWWKTAQFLAEWLKRSRSLPLRLTLYENKNNPRRLLVSDMAFFEICEVLRLHSARWTYLNLEYAPLGSRILSKLLSNLKVMPKSDSFDLHLGAYNQFIPVDLKTPLRPGRFHSKSTLLLDVIPCKWNNLTCLSLSNYQLGDVLYIIKSAPKLTHCVSQKMRHGSRKKVKPFKHEGLEDLELSFQAPGTDFFQNLIAPSLRRLRYDSLSTSNSHWRDEDFGDLVGFVVRSELKGHLLQSFTIGWHSASLPNYDTTSFLRVPEVTCVSIHSDLALSLLPKLSDISVFPIMQELRLGVHSHMMGPETCAALWHFVDEHNAKAKLAAESGKRASKVGYRSKFKNINVMLHSKSTSLTQKGRVVRVRMTKDTFSRLREVRHARPLRLRFWTRGVDLLNDPRCLEDDGSCDGFVVLRSLSL